MKPAIHLRLLSKIETIDLRHAIETQRVTLL